MEYALKVLNQYGPATRKPTRRKRFVDEVPCAYCRSDGVDPNYGNFSKCPVCGGGGQIKVNPPVVTCLSCSGSGYSSGYLSCLACRGTGVVSVSPEAGTCPKCRGTGEEGIFYCNSCKGQGIV